MTAAITASVVSLLPTRRLPTATAAAYTTPTNTASTPATSAFRTTTSRS
jgi:hypothetical protein